MTDTPAPVPRWARTTIYAGAGTFGALNLVVSSISIGTLAYQHLDLDIVRSIALGLTPDAGAMVAGTLWVACEGPLRVWGRNVSLGLVAGSVIGNGADVLAAAGLVAPHVLVILAVGLAVAAPVLALLMLHLVLLVRAAPVTAPSATRKTAAVVTPKPSAPPRDTPSDVTMPAALPAVDVTTSETPPVDEAPDERRRRLARERKQAQRDRDRQGVPA